MNIQQQAKEAADKLQLGEDMFKVFAGTLGYMGDMPQSLSDKTAIDLLRRIERRERAAVELIPHKCYLCIGCANREAIEPIHGGCPIWQWRGPQEAGKGETNANG